MKCIRRCTYDFHAVPLEVVLNSLSQEILTNIKKTWGIFFLSGKLGWCGEVQHMLVFKVAELKKIKC